MESIKPISFDFDYGYNTTVNRWDKVCADIQTESIFKLQQESNDSQSQRPAKEKNATPVKNRAILPKKISWGKYYKQIEDFKNKYFELLNRGEQSEEANILYEKLKAIGENIPQTNKTNQKTEENKDGSQTVTTDGTTPEGIKSKTVKRFGSDGNLINSMRIIELNDGTILCIEHSEKGNTKKDDDGIKTSDSYGIKFKDSNGETHSFGYSEIKDKKTGKLEIVNNEEKASNENFPQNAQYARTRYYYNDGLFEGRSIEYGQFEGLGVRTNIYNNEQQSFVTPNLHKGDANSIPLEVFKATAENLQALETDPIYRNISDITQKGNQIRNEELSEEFSTDEQGITRIPYISTYELKTQLTDNLYKVDYLSVKTIKSFYQTVNGELKPHSNEITDTLQLGQKTITLSNTGEEIVIDDANATYQGDPVNGILLEKSSTSSVPYTYTNENGEQRDTIIQTQLNIAFEHENGINYEQFRTVSRNIDGLFNRTQFIDPNNPENNSDTITFLEDGSVIDLETAKNIVGLN